MDPIPVLETARLRLRPLTIADAPTVQRLKRASGLPGSVRLIAFGIVIAFVGLALATFALILSRQEPDSLSPLLAISALVEFVGLGLLVSGWWLRRAFKEPVD